MNFNQSEFDNLINELDNCGDKHCGSIITSKKLKEEGIQFLTHVTKKCTSKSKPKNQKENKLKFKKYDKCFTKYKKRSNYYKKLTQRNKCVDKNCSVYKKKLDNFNLN